MQCLIPLRREYRAQNHRIDFPTSQPSSLFPLFANPQFTHELRFAPGPFNSCQMAMAIFSRV